MRKIIWISPHLPYDNVAHAGGKIENYYIKRLSSASDIDLKLLSFYWDEELKEFDLYNRVSCHLVPYHDKGFKKIQRNIKDLMFRYSPLDKYANVTTRYLKKNILSILSSLKKEGYFPDIIVLQWTQIIVFTDEIKKIFPKSKIVSIEEDVTFLSYRRKYEHELNRYKKMFLKVNYKRLKEIEVNSLNKSDLIIVNNEKDKALLLGENIQTKVRVWVPYFQSFISKKRNPKHNNNIIFYGDMSRPENYLSAEWFVEKVLEKNVNLDVSFLIVGGRKPDKSLFEIKDKRVKVLGFVDDISDLLSNSLCLVAPLLLGAGIKIKILEAMSAGLPVLTNEIGIEGIPAIDGEEFLFCKNPDDYLDNINKLVANTKLVQYLGDNSKIFINNKFNIDGSFETFIEWLKSM